MVAISDVTFSAQAQRYCAEFEIAEDDLAAARAAAWSLYKRAGWLAVRGRLPEDGREAIMFCRSSSPARVESFRVVS